MNKRWRNAGLYALLAIVVIALATALFDKQPQAKNTWRYSKFIEEVENNRIEKVTLSADRTKALVADPTAPNSSKIAINLPPDRELIGFLTEHDVDIVVERQTDDGVWLRALSSLFVPIL